MYLHNGTRWTFAAGDAVRSDAEFKESDHPRDGDGKFASGGGSVSPDQQDALDDYKENAFVNEWLRGDRSPAAGSEKKNRAQIAALDGLLSASKLPETTLYRGYSGASLSGLLKTGKFRDKAYTSGSTSEEVARGFADESGYIAKITIPAGHSGYAYPDDEQHEVILPRGMSFRIVGIDHTKKIITLKPSGSGTASPERKDAAFVESDHPRDNEGKFTSGGGGGGGKTKPTAAENLPKPTNAPTNYVHNHAGAMQAIIKKGGELGSDLEQTAKGIKAFAGAYASGSIAKYGNELLAHLEKHHGLKPGSLGKAVPKAAPQKAAVTAPTQPAAPAAPKAAPLGPAMPTTAPWAKPAPAAAPASPPPLPGAPTKIMKEIYAVGTGDEDLAFKHEEIGELMLGASKAEQTYAIAWGEYLQTLSDDEPEPTPAPAKPAATPKPPAPAYPANLVASSKPLAEKIKSIAEMKVPDSVKIEQLQEIYANGIAQGFSPLGTVNQYAANWIKHLGGELPASKQPAAGVTLPKPAASTTTAAPGTGGNSVQAPVDSSIWKRAQTFMARAKQFANAHANGTTAVVPSLEPSWWKNVAGTNAVKSYTGAGSSKINKALRAAHEPTAKDYAKYAAHIDDLFEEEGARLTQDVVLRRGETVPADAIDKWRKALQNGVSCRYMKEGFISTSIASQAAFGGNVAFEIIARKGTPALGAYAVSSHKSENEVLLRHGQTFEIFKIEDTGGGVTKVHMYSIV